MLLRNTINVLVCLLACHLLTTATLAFGLELGSPVIRNYVDSDYKGHGQVWSAIQDRRGVMYFSNTAGILQFNGAQWDLIEVSSNVAVRSMAMAPSGTIFYAANADFGYLSTEINGKVKAVSLKDKVPEADREFTYVWQVVSTKDGMYFLTKEKIFHFKNGKITVLKGKFATSQAVVINDNLIYIDADRGLSTIDDDIIIQLPQFSDLTNGTRVSLAQSEGHELIGVRASGDLIKVDLSSLWDPQRQRYRARSETQDPLWKTIPSDLNEFVKTEHAAAYRLYRINRDCFALATLKAGIVLFNRDGKFLRAISKSNGLSDNTVSHVYVDQSDNLWVSTNFGISYIELSRAQSHYGATNGLDGTILSAQHYKGKMYVGSFQQMLVEEAFQFSPNQTRPKFVPLKKGTGQVWQMMEVDGDLLAATAYGLAKIEGDTLVHIPNTPVDGFSLSTSKKWPNHLFMGAIGQFVVFKREGTKWSYLGAIKGVKDSVRTITEVENGDLWLSTENNGVILVHFDGASPLEAKLSTYGLKQGLPSEANNLSFTFNGQLTIATQKGLFRLNLPNEKNTAAANSFQADPDFASIFNSPPMILNSGMKDDQGGVIVASEKNGLFWLRPDGKAHYHQKPSVFFGAPSTDVPLYKDESGKIWIPHSGLTVIDPTVAKNFSQNFNVFIRSVVTRANRSLTEGNFASKDKDLQALSIFELPPKDVPEVILPYTENGLTFTFSAAYFERANSLQFRFKLDGFDDEWSHWGKLTTKEYTNIPMGKFNFRVQARNVYGVEGKEANYQFRVTAPWYFTIWAVLLWATIITGAISTFVFLYTRKLKNEKHYLEKLVAQRTQQLHEASLTDPLTGLRNRRFITEILQNDTADFMKYKSHLSGSTDFRINTSTDEIFGIYLLDLDHFKHVNDTYGHDGGDQLLKQFSEILTTVIREDDVVIRLGGEEFLIVLKKTQLNYLSVFAEKLLLKISTTNFDVGNGVIIQKTCSIGYVSFPFDLNNPSMISLEQTINLADMAMYYAKNHGRNRAVYVGPGTNWRNGMDELGTDLSSFEFGLEKNYLTINKINDDG